MKAVLDNVPDSSPFLTWSLTLVVVQPEPLKNLNELVKAQLRYFSDAAEALSAVQGEIEDLGVAAEGEYR